MIMIENLKNQLEEAQKEVDPICKLRQLKTIEKRLFLLIIDPKLSYNEKQMARTLMDSLVFSSN
jgi:hypothetical protein